MSTQEIVSDEELKDAFTGTNFGVADHRTLLHVSVFKKLVGYYCGHTITQVMIQLGLISEKTNKVTKKCIELVRIAYHKELLNGG